MTTFFSIDAANARIPDVRAMLLLLRDQRRELVRLRDRLIELGEYGDSTEPTPDPESDAATGSSPNRGTDAEVAHERPLAGPAVAPKEEARLLRLRSQGVIDQMQASVAKIDAWGISLRDIEAGLIDFPALANGRQVWLCWKLGEDDVAWYHELTAGVAGRRRLVDLV